MKIYTTNFASLKNVPKTIIPIAICGKTPEWWTGLKFPALAPKYWWWVTWKESGEDKDWYAQKYKETVLDSLIPFSVVQELKEMVGEGNDVALVCYEKPKEFCHRHLVAEWLRGAGYSVEEWEKTAGTGS